MLMKMTTTPTATNHDRTDTLCRTPLPDRLRSRQRWRQSSVGTAVVAVASLLIATTAWLSLVFSGTTTRCWHRFKDWESAPHSLPWNKPHSHPIPSLPLLSQPPPELSLNHIVFGIAGSSQLWKRRKEYVRLWWRPNDMRGHVWLEEPVPSEQGDDSLPPIMVSEDISRFRYTNPTGHPSGLRISRIVSECFRLRLPHVRWFVLSDDDTIFNADNLVTVLRKYDPSEMVYVGNPSESHSANSYFSHSMAFGGGGVAISYPLANAISRIQDDCLERYTKLYGSDDRLHACITELGIPLTREPGFHQVPHLPIPIHFLCYIFFTLLLSNMCSSFSILLCYFVCLVSSGWPVGYQG